MRNIDENIDDNINDNRVILTLQTESYRESKGPSKKSMSEEIGLEIKTALLEAPVK